MRCVSRENLYSSIMLSFFFLKQKVKTMVYPSEDKVAIWIERDDEGTPSRLVGAIPSQRGFAVQKGNGVDDPSRGRVQAQRVVPLRDKSKKKKTQKMKN